jgi:hypothetical protein
MPKKQRSEQCLGHKHKKAMQGTPHPCLEQLTNKELEEVGILTVGPAVDICVWAIQKRRQLAIYHLFIDVYDCPHEHEWEGEGRGGGTVDNIYQFLRLGINESP